MAKKPKTNLNIIARVDGAGNVTSEVRKINTAIGTTGKAVRDANEEASGMSGAMGKLGQAFDKFTPKLAGTQDKFKGLTAASAATVDRMKNIGGIISIIPGPLGVLGLAVTSVIGIFSTLSDIFKTEVKPATDAQKESVDSLAQAYIAMGEQATLAAVRQAQAAKQRQDADIKSVDAFEANVKAQQQLVRDKQVALQLARQELKEIEGNLSGRRRDWRQAQKTVYAAEQALKIEQDKLKTLRDQEPAQEAILQDILRIRKEQQDAKDKEAQAKRDAEAKAKEEQARLAQEQRDREAAAKQAAERARAQTQAEIALVAQLRKQADEARWASEEHTARETLERQVQMQKADAERQIKDRERLQEAYIAIDQAADAKRAQIAKKEAEDRAKEMEQVRTLLQADVTPTDDIIKIDTRIKALSDAYAKIQQMDSEERAKYVEEQQRLLDEIGEAEQARLGNLELAEAKKKQIYKEEVKRQWSLSEATKEAMQAQVKGLQEVSKALDAWGKGSAVIQAAQMTADGIQATCDALDYTAEAAANYAIGNIATGIGLTAAAAGKYAAAAAYAKGLIDLGFSAFDSGGGSSGASEAAAAATPTTSSLTGQQPNQGTTEINVTMTFGGQAGRLGRYLVEELNAEARTPGGARVNAGVIR